MQYDLDPRLLPPSGASVQCTHCSFVFTATPSGELIVPGQPQGAQGGTSRAAEVSRTSTSTTTQIFGRPAVAPPQPEERKPAAHTTQVFGAVTLPGAAPTAAAGAPVAPAVARAPTQPPAPSVSKTQVFGAPPPREPVPTTTQVFGAASIPTQAPSAATTQVFGAASIPTPAPSAATTQVFGAVSVPAAPASPGTTQSFGASEVREAERAEGSAAPARQAQESSASWRVEPGSSAPAPRSIPSLPPEPITESSGPMPASRRGPSLDLPPELFTSEESEREAPAREQAPGGRMERLLIALAAVLVLGVTAWLTYPAWRNRGSELPPEALSARDQAVLLLRRDDAASRAQAIETLRLLVASYPKFTEAQAELAVALALQLDDVKVDLEWLGKQEEQLRDEIRELQLAKAPADWQNRVNARREEQATLARQRQPLEATLAELKEQLEEAMGLIRAAPENEPSADVVARVKALAVHAAVTARPEALGLAERLRKVENPPHWSVLSRAEFGLNANSPPVVLGELAEALAEVREQDKTHVRAYVLGARLALRLREPATAKALLDSALVFSPGHTLARKLQQWAAASESAATPTP
jgi:flagellar basal body-associated protein FliL